MTLTLKALSLSQSHEHPITKIHGQQVRCRCSSVVHQVFDGSLPRRERFPAELRISECRGSTQGNEMCFKSRVSLVGTEHGNYDVVIRGVNQSPKMLEILLGGLKRRYGCHKVRVGILAISREPGIYESRQALRSLMHHNDRFDERATTLPGRRALRSISQPNGPSDRCSGAEYGPDHFDHGLASSEIESRSQTHANQCPQEAEGDRCQPLRRDIATSAANSHA